MPSRFELEQIAVAFGIERHWKIKTEDLKNAILDQMLNQPIYIGRIPIQRQQRDGAGRFAKTA